MLLKEAPDSTADINAVIQEGEAQRGGKKTSPEGSSWRRGKKRKRGETERRTDSEAETDSGLYCKRNGFVSEIAVVS